jgi:hypothetical protein
VKCGCCVPDVHALLARRSWPEYPAEVRYPRRFAGPRHRERYFTHVLADTPDAHVAAAVWMQIDRSRPCRRLCCIR